MREPNSRFGKSRPDIVVLHDFVLDHYATFRESLVDVLSKIQPIADRGGGNIVVRQYLSRGGKASNLASALAKLGSQVHLIARTSRFGHSLAKMFLESEGVDISCVKADGKLALTVSIETKHEGRPINIMVSDPGSNGTFGYSNISKKGLQLMDKSDGVVLADWALNSRGTGLAKGVFGRVGKSKLLMIDPGDVSRRKNEVKELIDCVLRKGYGILSLNESEAMYLAEKASGERFGQRTVLPEILGLDAAKVLAEEFNMRVDLHTRLFSATISNGHCVTAPTYKVEAKRVTGAGDAWNAGNIYAECIGLSDLHRLEFANALAAYYVSSPEGIHPTLKVVSNLVKSWRNRRRRLVHT
jgi:ribokinase